MRRVMLGASTLAVLALVMAASSQAQPIRVTVNGDPVSFEGTRPIQVNGRVLVPLRGVLEQMGAYVEWVPSTQTVIASKGDTNINLPIGSRWATVNGNRVALDVPAMTIAGRTMVPLRFIGESLGADVAWVSDTETVRIVTTGGAVDTADVNNYRAHRTGDTNDTTARVYDQPARRYYPGDYRDRQWGWSRAHRTVSDRLVLPAGTVIPVQLDQTLTSDGNVPGDRFTATVVDDGNPGLPGGTRFEGVVAEAVPARDNRPGVLDLDVRRVVFADGTSRAVDGSISSLDTHAVTRSGDRLVARDSAGSNERLKWVGIGAGAGFLISSLAGGNKLLDTLLGAGAGYLYNETQRRGAHNVRLSSGTEFGVRLDRQLAYAP